VQPFVPDLAIEIVSANDRYAGLMDKAVRYRKCGTREVWILSHANRQATVHSDDRRAVLDDNDIFESKLIPGFSIPLKDLFDHE
jgi:Uma2 family endonuclease